MAWYAIARELRPIMIGISRHFKGDKPWYDVWGVNSRLIPVNVKFNVQFYSIASGKKLIDLPMSHMLLPNQASEIWTSAGYYGLESSDTVISVSYELPSGEKFDSSANWPEPLKYIDFSDRKPTFSVEGEEITLRTNKPIKGLILDVEGDDDSGLEWSDNGFDLMPMKSVTVTAKALGERSVTVSWYGDT